MQGKQGGFFLFYRRVIVYIAWMEILLTAIIPLLLLAALLRALKHGFYALHLVMCAGGCWLAQHYVYGAYPIFSHRAIVIASCVHLASINIVTWLAYVADKRASMRGQWRIPERTLHAFALIGGTPAAWLAQKTLRHKNKKQSFRAMFWLVLLVQVAAIVYVASR